MDGNLLVVTGICNSDTGDSYFAADRHITPNSKTRNNITHTWPDISPQIAQQYYSYFLTAWPDIKITILLVSPLFYKCQIDLSILETYHHCLSEDDDYHSSLFIFFLSQEHSMNGIHWCPHYPSQLVCEIYFLRYKLERHIAMHWRTGVAIASHRG